jgi:CHAD domain-containing protein
MARKSALSPDPAARAMAELLRDITGSARKPLETPDITDSVAIHDFRKAFKRWRAALRLIAPVVGEEAEAMRIAARDLAREMAHARDGAAALEALSDLGDNVPTLSARSRATIEGRLTLLGANAEAASLTPDFKLRIAALLDQAAAAIQRWPIGEFDCEQATRQLTATYRRVRDSEPEDWSTAPADALHRMRQRIVEHRYQMELVEPVWPKLIKVWISESQRLRDRLGAHQDLHVLSRLTGPHQPLAYWRSRLAAPIAERQAAHVEASRRLAGRLFAEKPKAFRDRIAALWKHQTEDAELRVRHPAAKPDQSSW